GVWEEYWGRIAALGSVLLFEAALIVGLLYERRRRRAAEALARTSLAEVAHMNRVATAGELSASIAHQMNQPLARVVAHANAGLRWLALTPPNLDEARTSFRQIVDAAHHAAEVIKQIRAFFKKSPSDVSLVDVNAVVRAVLALVGTNLQEHKVTVE